MRLKIMACEVLFREICDGVAHSKNVLSVQFLRRGLHDNPDTLRTALQKEIEHVEAEEEAYDALLLGYGLCNNSLVGLQARSIPLVIPRAHDCITLFLGSKERYSACYEDAPGTYYYTSGWIERAGSRTERQVAQGEGLGKKYEEYAEKYGEENSRYLMQIEQSFIEHYTHAAYIDVPLARGFGYEAEVQKVAEQRGWEYKNLAGDMRLIRDLIDGDWNETDFLVVPPGKHVIATYDREIVACRDG